MKTHIGQIGEQPGQFSEPWINYVEIEYHQKSKKSKDIQSLDS